MVKNSREVKTKASSNKNKGKQHLEKNDFTIGGSGNGNNYDHDFHNGGDTTTSALLLSDDYTIADDDNDSTSAISLLDDNESLDNNVDTDVMLGKNKYYNGSHVTAEETASVQRIQRLHHTIQNLNEYTNEKRSSKREIILHRLFKVLTHYGTGIAGQEVISDYQDLIRTICFYSIRVGQPGEQYSACRIVEATSVLLGTNCDIWFDSINTTLCKLVTSSKIVPIRIAALRAICMSAIINSNDTIDTENLMDFIEQQLIEPSVLSSSYGGSTNTSSTTDIIPISLRAGAIECWSLLATTIDNFYLSGQDNEHIGRGIVLIPYIKDCLETTESTSSYINLRECCGECFALIHEARLDLGIMEHDIVEDSETSTTVQKTTTTARRYQRGSWENSQVEDDVEIIKVRIDELANQTGHYITKQIKKEIRKTFREILSTVIDNESPEEILYFNRNNSTLTLSTWKEIIQLQFIRHCFQGGFQIQLLTNNTIQNMFGFSVGGNGQYDDDNTNTTTSGPATNTSYSQLEKRLYLSKNGIHNKQSNIQLTKDRKKRNNIKNHFLTADD